MRKEIIIVGTIVAVFGIIFLPVSKSTTQTRTIGGDWQIIATYRGDNIPHTLENYLQEGYKYSLILNSSTGTIIGGPNTHLEIRDPADQMIFSTACPQCMPPHVEFQALTSGTYKIEWWGYYRNNDSEPIDSIHINKFVEEEETFYLYEGMFPLGILLIVIGAGISVVGTIAPIKPQQIEDATSLDFRFTAWIVRFYGVHEMVLVR